MGWDMLLDDGLALVAADGDAGDGEAGENGGAGRHGTYPTSRLCKGIVPLDAGGSLAEEGVGFGVPVLKLGLRTVFAGRVELTWRREGRGWQLDEVFTMDLVERLAGRGGALVPAPLQTVKDSIAAAHRRARPLRGALTATSSAARSALRLTTVYLPVRPVARVPVRVTVTPSGQLHVDADLAGLPRATTEAVLMNELGGQFDRYEDGDGLVLAGGAIGTWERVVAEEACLANGARGVTFSVRQAEGAVLYRGRESVGTRLNWSGFGFAVKPDQPRLSYDLSLRRLS